MHIKSFLIGVKNTLEKPWLQIIIFFVYSVIFLYYSVDIFKNSINSKIEESISNWLTVNALYILFFAVFLSALPILTSWLKKLEDSKLPSFDLLLSINTGFGKVVDSKATRFDIFFHNQKNKNPFVEDVFKEITKPKQQIILLAEVLHQLFQNSYTEVQFKVRIVNINKDKPCGWLTHAPKEQHPRTSISTLNKKNSTVKHCLSKGKIVIIEDIVKESEKKNGSRYYREFKDDDEVGSLICFPVYHSPTNCIPYVIAISTDKPFFIQEKKDLYLWILNQFSRRIQLEHTLLLLKHEASYDKIHTSTETSSL